MALVCHTVEVDLDVDGQTPSQYVAVNPTRLLDTRKSGTKPGPGSTTLVQVAGPGALLPITAAIGATAVVLNVTATEATAAGFVTVYPTCRPQPTVSSLNLEYAGQTIPNLVTVPVGIGGMVSLFTQAGTHLVVDIAGFYTPMSDGTEGRFIPVTPNRMMDTRLTKTPLGVGGSRDLTVLNAAGVPSNAAAVVVNITATESFGPGFVTAWPAGNPRPVASNLNVNGAGQTIANLAILPVGVGGKILLFSQSGTHLIVDITGYYTDDTAPASYLGIFVPLTPQRVLDARPDHKLPPGGVTSFDVLPGSPASAVVINVTATEAANAGFVTAWPAGAGMPAVSSLNVEHVGQTIPNAAILGVGSGNTLSLFSQSGTHLVVDLSGYFIVD